LYYKQYFWKSVTNLSRDNEYKWKGKDQEQHNKEEKWKLIIFKGPTFHYTWLLRLVCMLEDAYACLGETRGYSKKYLDNYSKSQKYYYNLLYIITKARTRKEIIKLYGVLYNLFIFFQPISSSKSTIHFGPEYIQFKAIASCTSHFASCAS